MNAATKVQQWSEQIPVNSVWPGAAVRISHGTRTGEIDFRKGRVIHVSDRAISVEMDHPLYPFVKLMGDSYAHYCPNCQRTIPGHVTYRRPVDFVSMTIDGKPQSIPLRYFCPFCGPPYMLRMLEPGDRLKLHYRFEKDAGSAAWFAEVWEW